MLVQWNTFSSLSNPPNLEIQNPLYMTEIGDLEGDCPHLRALIYSTKGLKRYLGCPTVIPQLVKHTDVDRAHEFEPPFY